MGEVYIDGIGHSKFGKDDDNLEVMKAKVGEEAFDNSMHRKSGDGKPDIVILANYNYIGYAGQASLDALVGTELEKRKIISKTTPVFHINRGTGSGAGGVEAGYLLAQTGKKVLVIGGEKMYFEGVDKKDITQETSKMIYKKEQELGVTMPIIAAIATMEYIKRYGISKDEIRKLFFAVLNRNRSFGAKNDYAYFKHIVSWDEYKEGKMVADPLTINDCAGTRNGAAALYLVPYETDIRLSTIRGAFTTIKTEERYTLASQEATVDAACAAFIDADLNPHEIDIVELHDAFSPVPIIGAEDIGFAERGKGADFVLNEKNKIGKTVPYNRSGGFLCKTHPIGASGVAQPVELTLQMRGGNQYAEMLYEYQKIINRALWYNIEALANYTNIGIIEKTYPSVKREGLDERNLPKHLKHRGLIGRIRERGKTVGSSEGFRVVKNIGGKLRLKRVKGKVPADAVVVSEEVGEILEE